MELETQVYDQLEAYGIPMVLPRQGNFQLYGAFDLMERSYKPTNPEYEARIQQIIKYLNQQDGKVIPVEDTKILSHLRTFFQLNRVEDAQRVLREFTRFSDAKEYITFDIETLGDALERKAPFSVIEIAMKGFRRDEHLQHIETGDDWIQLIAPSKELEREIKKAIEKLRVDKYSFYSMDSWMQQTLVNLMRYSHLSHGQDGAQFVYDSKGILVDLKHNPIVREVLDDNDHLVPRKMVENMPRYLNHIAAGLHMLKKHGEADARIAIQRYNQFLQQNQHRYFVSYNGEYFDLPTLEDWARQYQFSIQQPRHHLDYLKAIRVITPNVIDLHQEMGRNLVSRPFIGSMGSLQEFRRTLGIDTANAHSALYDIGKSGLAGVVEKSLPVLQERVLEGYQSDSPYFSWNEERWKTGSQLFSVGGVVAYREGEQSFQATWNANEQKWEPLSNAYNNTVINSKTIYRLDGFVDLSDEETKRYALRLYDADNEKYAFIVREGEHALDQLGGFLQSRFLHVDGLSEQERREIYEYHAQDLARRRYLRSFSLSNAGTGRTGGFEAAKRMYENASVLQRRILGKHKNIEAMAMERAAAELEGKNATPEEWSAVKDRHYQALMNEYRITHEEMMSRMNFDSLYVPGKGWTYNPHEEKDFWTLKERLLSEVDTYLPALQKIEQAFQEELEQAKGNRELETRVKQQRDLAWYLYHQQIQQLTKDQESTVQVPSNRILDQLHNRRVQFTDYQDGTKHSILFLSPETVEQGMQKYVYQKQIKENTDDPVVREMRYRERISRMVRSMEAEQIISSELARRWQEWNASSNNIYNTIRMIATDMQQHQIRFQDTQEMISLSANKALQEIDQGMNMRLVEDAIRRAKGITNIWFTMQQSEGNRIDFDESFERILNELDQIHASGLAPNNRRALEKILADMQEHPEFRQLQVALSYDSQAKIAKISIFRPENSTSVMEHLAQGLSHPKAVELMVPLIGPEGVHMIGNRRLNARSFLTLDQQQQFVLRSSVERIADAYSESMGSILNAIHEGDIELAQKRARRTLNRSIEELSGIQRNGSFNDTYYFQRTPSDFFKQSQVDIQSAYIHDLYRQGKLVQEDFRADAFNERGELKPWVTLDDLTRRKAYEIMVSAGDWLEQLKVNEQPFPLFASSVKAEHVAKGILSMQDIRDFLPYGHYTFMGRDNPVQFMNIDLLDDEVQEGLHKVRENTGAYIRFDPLVTTDQEQAFMREWRNRYQVNEKLGVQLKVAFMTNEQLLARIRELANDTTYQDLLFQHGIIEGFDIQTKQAILNPLAIPRIYEQQGLVAEDVMRHMRVWDYKLLTANDQFELVDGLQEGATVKPRQLIGYAYVNGQRQEIRWEKPNEATIFIENGRLGAKWKEDVFKLIAEGEKATDVTISRELLAAITGDATVSLVLNPNIKKHRDYGMWLSGKAKILAQHAQDLYQQMQQAFADKASALGQKRFQLQEEWNQLLEMAKQVNLEWDGNQQVFVQRGNDPIPTQAFRNIFDELNIQDRTSLGYETAILEVRASKVRNYGKVVDETGQQVLSVWHDKAGQLRKTYKVGRDGVNWSHREMRTLQELGLMRTYEMVFDTMKAQAEDADNYAYYQSLNPDSRFRPKSITRWQEAQNYIAALTGLADSSHPLVDQHQTLSLEQFRPLPENELNEYTYKGTIFDHEYVQRLLEARGENAPKHGYWLELPGIESSKGNEKYVTLNIDGSRAPVKRIFVPFMNLEGANGDIYLRELQQHIADIYRRAQDVENSPNRQARQENFRQLQDAVNKYYENLVYQISSSKGLLGDQVFRAAMPNSASGLFKLLDPETSAQLDGEYTFISEIDAKAMGVYDKLVEIERLRSLGKQVDDLFVMNVRYPTFHKNAMQVAKLRLGENLKQGEFATTSLMSSYMKADSDGDYDHIVVIDNEDVQKEWKRLYERQMKDRDEKYRTHIEKQSTQNRGFDASFITGDSESFEPFTPNTEEEMAAKMGKRAIGSASNLNLYLHQLADEFLDHGSKEVEDLKTFGAALEQELISSKHARGKAMVGRAPAFEMIEAIYRGDWTRAREIDEEFFGSEFQTKHKMNEAFRSLDQIAENLKNGLYNDSLRFGTSYGLNVRNLSVKQIADMLHGSAQNQEVTLANSLLNMIQRMLGVQMEKTYDDGTTIHRKVNPYQSIEAQTRTQRESGVEARLGEVIDDVSGRTLADFGEKVRETLKNNKTLKRGILGGALALGGLSLYNIISHDQPLEPLPSSNDEQSSAVPTPALSMPMNQMPAQQNAQIMIRASGKGYDEQQLAHMVQQGMSQANMNHGSATITIHHNDNTQKLNRFWYRDKIEENL